MAFDGRGSGAERHSTQVDAGPVASSGLRLLWTCPAFGVHTKRSRLENNFWAGRWLSRHRNVRLGWVRLVVNLT